VLLGQQLQARLLGSDSEKGPVSLRLPVNALDVLFPRLFLASSRAALSFTSKSTIR
jgi:hypothetical protein